MSTPARWRHWRALNPDTALPGLYLVGQDVVTCGMMGAVMSGIMAAGRLDYNALGLFLLLHSTTLHLR